ncbi:glycosyltransferase [Mycolicibacterium phlei]
MASIVICSVPAQGHVAPLLSVARDFADRGDDVRFLTGSAFADRVAATGAEFVPLPAEAERSYRGLNEQFPERARLRGTRALVFDLEHLFAAPAMAQYRALTAALEARAADVVLAEPVFIGATLLLGLPRPARPAVVMCGVLPLMLLSRDIAPYGAGLPPARRLNRARNTALLALHKRILKRANDILVAYHRQLHGVPMPGWFADWGRRAEALVQFTVPSFEYPLSDAPPNLHFAGPLSATGSQAPLPQWWDDLDGGRPVVHVTQGTVANDDYDQVIAPTLRALAGDDVLVVVATGGRPVATLPALPPNARAAEFLPYDQLLPRTSVFVTNGGYGGVQYALRYGVPVVATGGQEDKPEVSARVAWSGVGRRIRSEQPKPRAMRRAIHAVLGDPRYRQASARMAAEMAAAPGFGLVADLVDTLAGSARVGPGRLCNTSAGLRR